MGMVLGTRYRLGTFVGNLEIFFRLLWVGAIAADSLLHAWIRIQLFRSVSRSDVFVRIECLALLVCAGESLLRSHPLLPPRSYSRCKSNLQQHCHRQPHRTGK